METYPAQSEIELDLKVGDIIYVHKKREDGWFKGTLQRSGKTGLFPGSFVEKSQWGTLVLSCEEMRYNLTCPLFTVKKLSMERKAKNLPKSNLTQSFIEGTKPTSLHAQTLN